MPFLIPEMDEMVACNWANYRYFDDWKALSYDERVFIIASYYGTLVVESHRSDAKNAYEEKQMKRARAKGKK